MSKKGSVKWWQWLILGGLLFILLNPKVLDWINGLFTLWDFDDFIKDARDIVNRFADWLKGLIPPAGGAVNAIMAVPVMIVMLPVNAAKWVLDFALKNIWIVPIIVMFGILAFLIYFVLSIPLGIPLVPFI